MTSLLPASRPNHHSSFSGNPYKDKHPREILSKKEALRSLESALKKRIKELKELCLKEGELTGHLPIDYPLQPREPIPQVRRRQYKHGISTTGGSNSSNETTSITSSSSSSASISSSFQPQYPHIANQVSNHLTLSNQQTTSSRPTRPTSTASSISSISTTSSSQQNHHLTHTAGNQNVTYSSKVPGHPPKPSSTSCLHQPHLGSDLSKLHGRSSSSQSSIPDRHIFKEPQVPPRHQPIRYDPSLLPEQFRRLPTVPRQASTKVDDVQNQVVVNTSTLSCVRASSTASSASSSGSTISSTVSAPAAVQQSRTQVGVRSDSNKELRSDLFGINEASKFQTYYEETKPFQMSDFYRYSSKHRGHNPNGDGQISLTSRENCKTTRQLQEDILNMKNAQKYSSCDEQIQSSVKLIEKSDLRIFEATAQAMAGNPHLAKKLNSILPPSSGSCRLKKS